jgi:hypothetical protein
MKRVGVRRVELHEPVRKARLVILKLQRTPFEEVASNWRDLVPVVELGLLVERYRPQEVAGIVIDAP